MSDPKYMARGLKALLDDSVEVLEDMKKETTSEDKKQVASYCQNEIEKTSDKVVEIVSSDKKYWQCLIEDCKGCMTDIKQRYVLLGCRLIQLDNMETLKQVWSDKKGRPCKTIYELAEQELRLEKGFVSRVMGVVKKFGEYIKSALKNEYQEYSFSQLQEMLPLTKDQLELVNPSMSKNDIRALKKASPKTVAPAQQNSEDQLPNVQKSENTYLTLKNDKERLAFLSLYETWGIWLEVPELNMSFYRCDLNNGDFILVTKCPCFMTKNYTYYEYYQKNQYFETRIVKQGTSPDYYGYSPSGMSEASFLSYMKSTKAKVRTMRHYESFEEYRKDMEVENA